MRNRKKLVNVMCEKSGATMRIPRERADNLVLVDKTHSYVSNKQGHKRVRLERVAAEKLALKKAEKAQAKKVSKKGSK